MKFNSFDINGPLLFEHEVFTDSRGLFFEEFNSTKFNKIIGINYSFVQDNVSISNKGVVRGLHYQIEPYDQAKYISVKNGKIFDVFVDLRRDSSFFGQWRSVILDAQKKASIWIPQGFAHGFQALEDNSIIQYKVTQKYMSDFERIINVRDNNLKINWPIKDMILSKKDLNAPFFNF